MMDPGFLSQNLGQTPGQNRVQTVEPYQSQGFGFTCLFDRLLTLSLKVLAVPPYGLHTHRRVNEPGKTLAHLSTLVQHII